MVTAAGLKVLPLVAVTVPGAGVPPAGAAGADGLSPQASGCKTSSPNPALNNSENIFFISSPPFKKPATQ